MMMKPYDNDAVISKDTIRQPDKKGDVVRPILVGQKKGVDEIIVSAILLLCALIILFPLVLPFFFVFKTRLEFNYDPWGLPSKIQWKSFVDAWNALQLGESFINTIIVCFGTVALTVPIACMSGYVFARYKSKITEILFYFVLMGYFVPVQMVLIPLARTSSMVGLIDTLPGLFLPMVAFGIPFWTMIYRSFFKEIPKDLADAAQIDGAGHFNTFFLIMAPLAKPATILAIILTFMGAWSDFILSLVIINSQKNFTLQLRVAQFLQMYGSSNMPQYAAALLIAITPTILIYIICYKQILQGTIAGALKG
jgi:ABC-type glycerol-3-phosphate transport system permease component